MYVLAYAAFEAIVLFVLYCGLNEAREIARRERQESDHDN